MSTECSRIRQILQNICDENLEIPRCYKVENPGILPKFSPGVAQGIQNHIITCPGCKEYWEALSSLGTSLAEEIDEKLKTMAPPDFGLIYRKKKQRRLNLSRPVIWGIAAIFVLSLGIFINSLLSVHRKNAEYISSDVRSFVTDIFSRPILYDDMLTNNNGNGVSEWFETGILLEETFNGDSVDMGIDFFDESL